MVGSEANCCRILGGWGECDHRSDGRDCGSAASSAGRESSLGVCFSWMLVGRVPVSIPAVGIRIWYSGILVFWFFRSFGPAMEFGSLI